MVPLSLLDLFSGIGGFSIGLEKSQMFETAAFCEINPFCQKVLAKHWPKIPIYDDIATLSAERLRNDGIAIDAICGGFPCQDVSEAGSGKGIKAERSGLWFEYARLISEIRPRYVIVENVTGLLTRGFDDVLATLAQIGYDAEWHCIQAADIGAPHIRDRVWIIAYPSSIGSEGDNIANEGKRSKEFFIGRRLDERINKSRQDNGWPTEPYIPRVAYGVPNRSHRLNALGNALVPKIPEIIGLAIKDFEQKK